MTIKVLDKGHLVRADLLFRNQIDILVAQQLGNMLHCSGIVFGIKAVELVYLLDQLQRGLAFLVVETILVFGNPALGSDPDPEELVQVIGIDAEERKPFQQGHIVLASFLQDTPIEIHPAQVPFQNREILLFCHDTILVYRAL